MYIAHTSWVTSNFSVYSWTYTQNTSSILSALNRILEQFMGKCCPIVSCLDRPSKWKLRNFFNDDLPSTDTTQKQPWPTKKLIQKWGDFRQISLISHSTQWINNFPIQSESQSDLRLAGLSKTPWPKPNQLRISSKFPSLPVVNNQVKYNHTWNQLLDKFWSWLWYDQGVRTPCYDDDLVVDLMFPWLDSSV